MRRIAVLAIAMCVGLLPVARAQAPYKILTTVKVGGEGGYDYVNADAEARRLYIARSGPAGRITVFDLDTLKPIGEVPHVSAHGVAIDTASHHGFATSKPVAMFDSVTLAPIKTIAVQGSPDGILEDPALGRVYILSHSEPNVTVLDAKDGAILGTINLGGEPEQAALDGKGMLYIDLEDKGSIAVVDTKSLTVTKRYDLAGKGGTCAGLAMDVKNNILFSTCRSPQTMVILNAGDGKILATLPIGLGSDGAVFNPATMEAFSTQGDGTLTVVKETTPTSFAVEQTVTMPVRARTLTLDTKTGHIVSITAEFAAPPAVAPGARPGRGVMVPGSFCILVVGK